MCAGTSALGVAGSAAVLVVRVEHCDVAALVLQVDVLLQLLQSLVRTHVGVGELCRGSRNKRKVSRNGDYF